MFYLELHLLRLELVEKVGHGLHRASVLLASLCHVPQLLRLSVGVYKSYSGVSTDADRDDKIQEKATT